MTITSEQLKMSEAEFLDAQAADAQAAFRGTCDDLKETLNETANLEVWARRHPWMVAGAAVAGGFLLATLLFPSAKPDEDAPERVGENGRPSRAEPRRMSWLFGTLFNLLKPVFGQLLSSLIAAAMGALGGSLAQPPEEPSADEPGAGNGAGPVPGEGPVPA